MPLPSSTVSTAFSSKDAVFMPPSMAKSQESCGRLHTDACHSPEAGLAHDSSSLFDEFTSENDNSDDLSFSNFVSEEECSGENRKILEKSSESISSSGITSLESVESAAPVSGGQKKVHLDIDPCITVNTGFITGKRNVITVREISLDRARCELECSEIAGAVKRRRPQESLVRAESVSSVCTGGRTYAQEKYHKVKSTDTTASINMGHSLRRRTLGGSHDELLYMKNMKDVFLKVRDFFPRVDKMWFFEQFKWSWLSLFFRCMLEEGVVQRIVDQINMRKKREYSVLRRIVEGDDISSRYMVLLVTQILSDCIEVFDGSYSVLCIPNPELSKKIANHAIRAGQKLRVIGADYLMKEPADFFSVRGPILRLFSNSVRQAPATHRLGYQRKCAFLVNLCEVTRHGGPVSGVEVSVREIIENKVFLKCGNYKKMVGTDSVDRELERMSDLARSSNADLKIEEIVVRRYIKMVVCDGSGECILTWWNHDEARPGHKYRFLLLKVVESALGLHLATTNRTQVKRLA